MWEPVFTILHVVGYYWKYKKKMLVSCKMAYIGCGNINIVRNINDRFRFCLCYVRTINFIFVMSTSVWRVFLIKPENHNKPEVLSPPLSLSLIIINVTIGLFCHTVFPFDPVHGQPIQIAIESINPISSTCTGTTTVLHGFWSQTELSAIRLCGQQRRI